MTYDSIAAALRRYRKQAGYTQRELAGRAGVSLVTVVRHESGARIPGLPFLERYAEALGLHPFAILGSAAAPLRNSAPPEEADKKASIPRDA